LATLKLTLLIALVFEPSVAMMLTARSPTSPLAGVPDRVMVDASNWSQLGSAEPSASVAV